MSSHLNQEEQIRQLLAGRISHAYDVNIIINEVIKLLKQAETAARYEGAEMCHNALFHNAKSVNNIIELDTGETAIRFNNLLKELKGVSNE